MQSRACKKKKTVTAPNKVRDVMKGGIASTWINLDQPGSTCINLHQPASTSINLHQPASEEMPLTIGTPHVARPDVVFLRRDRREIDIGQKHGHPVLLWVVGVCPPRREKRKEPVSLVILVTAVAKQKCSEQPRQRRVIRTPACQACTHAPAPERSKALVPSSPCTAAKMFLSGVRWHTQTSPWQKLNHTRQHTLGNTH